MSFSYKSDNFLNDLFSSSSSSSCISLAHNGNFSMKNQEWIFYISSSCTNAKIWANIMHKFEDAI